MRYNGSLFSIFRIKSLARGGKLSGKVIFTYLIFSSRIVYWSLSLRVLRFITDKNGVSPASNS